MIVDYAIIFFFCQSISMYMCLSIINLAYLVLFFVGFSFCRLKKKYKKISDLIMGFFMSVHEMIEIFYFKNVYVSMKIILIEKYSLVFL